MVKSLLSVSAALFLLLSACSSTNSKPVLITFAADSAAILFNNIDQAGLLQLKNASAKDSVFNGLISVLHTPSENDTTVKEVSVEGVVNITDSNIVFKPVKPFVKGNGYLVITYLNARFGNAEKMLKGELSYRIKPQQKLLTR